MLDASDVIISEFLAVNDGSLRDEDGDTSDWIEVTWDALPMGLMPVTGTVRFYPMSLRPGFELYASPVNLSPAGPAMAITSPEDFVDELYQSAGA